MKGAFTGAVSAAVMAALSWHIPVRYFLDKWRSSAETRTLATSQLQTQFERVEVPRILTTERSRHSRNSTVYFWRAIASERFDPTVLPAQRFPD